MIHDLYDHAELYVYPPESYKASTISLATLYIYVDRYAIYKIMSYKCCHFFHQLQN